MKVGLEAEVARPLPLIALRACAAACLSRMGVANVRVQFIDVASASDVRKSGVYFQMAFINVVDL